MTLLPIALTAAGAAALVNFWLALRIGRVRTAEKVSIGDGGNPLLIARMRAQANFVEYTPFVLILIALIELALGSSLWLWVVSGVYIIGRVLHGIGMGGQGPWRLIGTVVTMLVLVGLALVALTLPHLSPARSEMHTAVAAI